MTYSDRFEPRQALALTAVIVPLAAGVLLGTVALFGFIV